MTYKYVSTRTMTRGQATAESQENKQTAIWDTHSIEYLLKQTDRHYELINTEPYRSWIMRRGGMRRVQEHIEAVLQLRLLPRHQSILQSILDGEGWRDCIKRLHIARATYFDRRKAMIHALVDLINFEWTAPYTPILCARCAKVLAHERD